MSKDNYVKFLEESVSDMYDEFEESLEESDVAAAKIPPLVDEILNFGKKGNKDKVKNGTEKGMSKVKEKMTKGDDEIPGMKPASESSPLSILEGNDNFDLTEDETTVLNTLMDEIETLEESVEQNIFIDEFLEEMDVDDDYDEDDDDEDDDEDELDLDDMD